jgi:hypothetical protein
VRTPPKKKIYIFLSNEPYPRINSELEVKAKVSFDKSQNHESSSTKNFGRGIGVNQV